jgi:hypothetical protein
MPLKLTVSKSRKLCPYEHVLITRLFIFFFVDFPRDTQHDRTFTGNIQSRMLTLVVLQVTHLVHELQVEIIID